MTHTINPGDPVSIYHNQREQFGTLVRIKAGRAVVALNSGALANVDSHFVSYAPRGKLLARRANAYRVCALCRMSDTPVQRVTFEQYEPSIREYNVRELVVERA